MNIKKGWNLYVIKINKLKGEVNRSTGDRIVNSGRIKNKKMNYSSKNW